jgi:pimeloyl-ACP methyl ester carboxylesterase
MKKAGVNNPDPLPHVNKHLGNIVRMLESSICSSVWNIAGVALAVYVLLIILVAVFQSHFIFFPERRIMATPDLMQLPFEEVAFVTEDNVILFGWFIPREDSKGVVLFCHGNAGNISHRLDSLNIFYRLGLSTFIFDYRGYGRSRGKITEEGTYRDAEAAWNYLIRIKEYHPNEIIIFGRSLGGTIAARLARHHKPKGLIIESTFTSVPDIAARLYPYLPVRLLARYRYKAIDDIRDVRCPVLVVHSRNDEIIPFSHGQKLFEAASNQKEFLEISGSHNEGFLTSGKHYTIGLRSFIDKLSN